MSWSVGSKGKSAIETAAEIEKQFTSSLPCDEPEESIRQGARRLIAEALAANTRAGSTVELSAYGSMDKDFTTGEVTNSLSIIIAPSW